MHIVNALKKIDNSIYLAGCSSIPGMGERLNEFKKYNPSIETILLKEGKHLPHLECPEQMLTAMKTYLY